MTNKDQLITDINNSSTLKTYTLLNKTYQRFKEYFWGAFVIAFALGFAEVVFTNNTTEFAYILMSIVGYIGIAFGFTMAGYHIATGSKLKNLASEYGMSIEEVQSIAGDTLK